MIVRKAETKDFEQIMDIYRYAQEYMISSGNPDQWGHFYPTPELIESDIAEGISYIICDKNDIHGVFAMIEGSDPTYRYIEGGKWLNDDPYVTIHRIAGDGQIHGLFDCASDYSKSVSRNVRIDTHRNNTVMQRLIRKNGFTECGTIYVDDGTPRIAYQWTKG